MRTHDPPVLRRHTAFSARCQSRQKVSWIGLHCVNRAGARGIDTAARPPSRRRQDHAHSQRPHHPTARKRLRAETTAGVGWDKKTYWRRPFIRPPHWRGRKSSRPATAGLAPVARQIHHYKAHAPHTRPPGLPGGATDSSPRGATWLLRCAPQPTAPNHATERKRGGRPSLLMGARR